MGRIGQLFIPKRKFSRSLVAFFLLWVAWFLYYVYTVGKVAYVEVQTRFVEVIVNAQLFAEEQLKALRLLWATLESFGRLVAPFVVDVVAFVYDLFFALPIEARFGIGGGSIVTYWIFHSRRVRHMFFIPIAAGLWCALSYVPPHIGQFLLPLVGLVIPVLRSLIAFVNRGHQMCGFWLSYWFLFPIMKVTLMCMMTYLPQSTSSRAFYWRAQCISASWLVLWGGSDLAFGVVVKILLKIWHWISRTGVATTLVRSLFSCKRRADGLRCNDAVTQWRIMQKLKQFASMGAATLGVGCLSAFLILLIVYRLVSLVSTVIAWPWFLYELGNVVHRKTIQLYRAKIALALLYLLFDWAFRQPWFIIPGFIMDFIRLPTIIIFNIFGEMLLDMLMSLLREIFTAKRRASTKVADDDKDTNHALDALPDKQVEIAEKEIDAAAANEISAAADESGAPAIEAAASTANDKITADRSTAAERAPVDRIEDVAVEKAPAEVKDAVDTDSESWVDAKLETCDAVLPRE